MAEARTFQAKIELMGRMHASLSGAVRMAQGQLNRLGAAARKIGAAMGRGFAKLGAMVKSFAGQIIGLTLAYAGLRSAAEFIGKSKEQFKANQEAAEMLNATLANNPKILKLGARELDSQQKRFSDLADSMQESSVYASSMWREAFTGLAQWGAGAADAEKLAGSINNILAAKGGLKATAGDAKALGDTLGKIVRTGKFGKFAKEYGLSKEDQKRFAAMRTSAERIAELNRIISSKYGGRAAALGATEAGEIRKAENRIADFQSRMGKGFMAIEGDWIKFVSRMIPLMEPAVEEMTKLFHKGLKGIMDFIEKDFVPAFTQLGVDPEIIAAWQKFSKVANELGEALSPIVNWVKDLLGLDTSMTFKDFVKAEVVQTLKDFSGLLGKVKEFLDWIKGFKWPEWKLPEFPAFKIPELPELSFAKVIFPDFSGLERDLNTVKNAVENVAKAFGLWDIPAALKSGLDWVIEKAGQVTKALSGAGGAVSAAGRPVETGTSGHALFGRHQYGGIFNQPHLAQIAEAGPEAVIPLRDGERSRSLLGAAASALGVRGGSSFNVNYTPNFTVNGAGPEVATQIERIVRAGHDELLRQIEALDSEMMRRAFV